jgi:hypothetical protein
MFTVTVVPAAETVGVMPPGIVAVAPLAVPKPLLVQ